VAALLLTAGADPELPDKQGRSALDLIAALKQNTPSTPDFFARRGALDQVAKELETHLYEELEPRAILSKRMNSDADGTGPPEYLVYWGDGAEDTWEVRLAQLRTRLCQRAAACTRGMLISAPP
jgi:hypothetical protein